MSIYMSNSSNMVIKLRMHLTHFYIALHFNFFN